MDTARLVFMKVRRPSVAQVVIFLLVRPIHRKASVPLLQHSLIGAKAPSSQVETVITRQNNKALTQPAGRPDRASHCCSAVSPPANDDVMHPPTTLHYPPILPNRRPILLGINWGPAQPTEHPHIPTLSRIGERLVNQRNQRSLCSKSLSPSSQICPT